MASDLQHNPRSLRYGEVMMGHREKLRGGAEYDAFYARRLYTYLQRSKIAKKIKRQFWGRIRAEQRAKPIEE